MVGMAINGTTNSNIGLSLSNTISAFLQLSVRDNIAQSFRGEDLDNDGVLDGGEDLNGNGTLDLGYGFNIVAEDSSTITGNASGDPVTGFLFNNNTSTANGSGLAYSANTGGTVNISVTGNILSGNVGASTGVSVMADAGTVNMFSLANNAIQNNVGNGVELYAMNGGTITSLLSEDLNNDSTINEAETDDNLNGVADPDEDVNSNGLLDPSEDTNGNAVLDLGITGNVITGNGGNGFIAVADNGSITGLHIGSADLNLPRATTVGALTTPDNIITDNGTATTIGGGIVIQTAAGGGTITGSIVNNLLDNSRDGSLSDNEGDNIFVSAAGGGTITLDSISNNSATGAGSAGGTSSAGLHFALADSSQITITDGIRYNSFNNNTGASFCATSDSGKLDVGTVTTNNFNRTVAGTHGALINATNNGQFAGTFIRNTFNGDVTANANTGVGFLLRADGGIAGETDIDVAIGSVNTSDANSFVGNTDVGIGFELTGSRTDPLLAEVSIRNNTIQSTTDGGLAGYAGEAIVLNVDGSGGAVVPLGGPQVNSVLQDSVIANNLIGHATDTTLANVSTGLSINVSGYGSIQDLLVDSNGIFDSGTNGIDFNRSGSASLEAVTQTHAIVFSNNTVDRSTLNAVNITTDGTKFYTDSTTINDQDMLFDTNTLSNSGAFGVQMVYGGDSRLVVDLTDNLIERNASGGIDATHQFVIFPPPFVADDPDMFGTYLGNVIRLNGTDINDAGIAIRGSATVSIGDGTEAGRNIIGGLAADGLTRNGNTGDGIFVDLGDNNVTINTNTITYNGGDGIDLESNGVATITNNNISHNGLDGIEILTPGTSTLFQSWDVTINQNTIARNQGRGVDLLNRSNATTSLRVDDNTIVNNGQEGVYIVNTSSETQTQDGLGTDALASDGAINRVPTVFARISGNTITGNGTVAQADSIGGLVLRGGSSTSADTYLSTNGQIAPPLATQLDLTTGDEFSALGKIEAEIENNLFGGNWGYDFYVDTFTSTVDPATTAGTWNTTTFTLTQLQRDPLARIDIVRFRGNCGDSMLVTGPLNGGAFYNNAEGTFKSRTNNLTPAGPFPQAGGATRRRNATRIAGDGSPFVGPGSNFQYDGFGSQSTLRVESGAQDAGFFGSGRFSDSVGFTNTVFGEFSYIWDQTLAPDTVFP